MNPTIKKTNFVFINKSKSTFPIKHGQIIALHWPLKSNIILIKRVSGVPEDIIDNKIHKRYKKPKDADASTVKTPAKKMRICLWNYNNKGYVDGFCNLKIPRDMYFVTGDNRTNSNDSRSWGLVSKSQIIGRVYIL